MIPALKDLVENVKTVCITGHIRPDGDCVGSVLGLYLYLKKNFPEIETDAYLEAPTDRLSFIAGFEALNSRYPDHEPYDLMFCLDCGSLDRIGKAEKYFKKAKHTINVDHHISNTNFADENYVNGSSSSACEEIYKFMDPALMDRDCAIAIYTGIIYDTGVFKYRSTSSLTMRIAADLMEFDIPTDDIIDRSFYAKSFEENRIFGYSVLNSHLTQEGRVIYATLTRKEMKEFGVSSKELEGIVAQLRLTKGVLVAVFLYETPAGDIKVSLRSNDPFDVNAIALQFGGGGHVRASGANIKGTLEECLTSLLAAIEEQMKSYEL